MERLERRRVQRPRGLPFYPRGQAPCGTAGCDGLGHIHPGHRYHRTAATCPLFNREDPLVDDQPPSRGTRAAARERLRAERQAQQEELREAIRRRRRRQHLLESDSD